MFAKCSWLDTNKGVNFKEAGTQGCLLLSEHPAEDCLPDWITGPSFA